MNLARGSLMGALTLSVAMTAATLSGCLESSPSESTIKKQIENQFSACRLMSVENFEKINGFPQNDGSHLIKVKYRLVLKPSHDNSILVREYIRAKEELEASGADARQHAKTIKEKIDNNVRACDHAMRQAAESPSGPSRDNHFARENYLSQLDDEQRLCRGRASILDRADSKIIAMSENIDISLRSLLEEYLNKVTSEFQSQCRIIAMGGVTDAYFNESRHNVLTFGKELTAEYSGTVRLIKSDNGWVMK